MFARDVRAHGLPKQIDAIGRWMRRALRRLPVFCTALCLALGGVVQAAPAAGSAETSFDARAVPALDAVVSYETKQVTSAGITRIESWKERIVRRGDTVWSERVLPPQARAAHSHETRAEHAGHKHFDVDGAVRWVQLDAKGQTVLRYVDQANRMVVSVPRPEYDAVGFDGRFDAAAMVVPRSVVDRMPLATASLRAPSDAQWHEEKGAGWSHRVLWSTRHQVALRVESSRADGSFSRTVTVEPVAATASLPWMALSGYAQKEYDDFMD